MLSSPAPRAEAVPADLIAWTDGRVLVATGSEFSPVTYRGITHVVGQVNNAMLYPGLALGTIVSKASRVSNRMFAAAANAVSSLVTVRQPGASLLPHVDDLRSVSVTVAVAVVEAAIEEAGLNHPKYRPTGTPRYRRSPNRQLRATIYLTKSGEFLSILNSWRYLPPPKKQSFTSPIPRIAMSFRLRDGWQG